MSKITAIIGPPGSGKTTTAFKLAQYVYFSGKAVTVMFISPDTVVPSLGLLFPNYQPHELVSMGTLFDKTSVTHEDVLRQTVTVKTMKNFGCLGYRTGENRFSFPSPTADKVRDLFSSLTPIDHVFVDCTDDDNDPVSVMALSAADSIVEVVNPDLKSMTYHAGLGGRLPRTDKQIIPVINRTGNDLYYPLDDMGSRLGSVAAVLPYSKEVKQQMLDGRLYERPGDKKYLSEISRILRQEQ